MPSEEVELVFAARMEAFERELASLPDVGQRQAKKLVRAMEREYRRGERSAADSARKVEREWGDTFESLTRLGSAATGGAFGDLLDVTEHLGKGMVGLAGSAGLVGAGFAAVTYAAYLGVGAMFSFMESAQQARDRLEELEGVDSVSPAALAALEEWEGAALAAEAAGARLQVLLAGALSEAVSSAAQTVAGALLTLGDLVEWADDTAEGLRGVVQAARTVNRVLTGISTLGLSEVVRYGLAEVQERGAEAAATVEDVSDAVRGSEAAARAAEAAWSSWAAEVDALALSMGGMTDEEVRLYQAMDRIDDRADALLASLEQQGDLTEETVQQVRAEAAALQLAVVERYELARATRAAAEAERERAEVARRQAAAAREAAREQQEAARAVATVQRVALDAARDLETAEQRVTREYEERIATLDAVQREQGEIEGLSEAYAAAEERRIRELGRLEQERIAARMRLEQQAAQQAADLSASLAEAQRVLTQELVAWGAAQVGAALDLGSAVAGAMAEIHGQQMADIQDEFRAEKERFWERHRNKKAELRDQLESGELTQEQYDAELDRMRERKGEFIAEQNERRKAAKRQFRAQKQAQRAQAWIDYGRAITALIPSVAYLGPGAPAAAGAIATISLGMALRNINRQKMPEFSLGGSVAERYAGSTSPDHVLISSRLDEGLVSPRGMATIGPDGLDRINRGEALAPTVILQLDGRTIAESYERSGRAHLRPPAGRVSGRAPVYGRG